MLLVDEVLTPELIVVIHFSVGFHPYLFYVLFGCILFYRGMICFAINLVTINLTSDVNSFNVCLSLYIPVLYSTFHYSFRGMIYCPLHLIIDVSASFILIDSRRTVKVCYTRSIISVFDRHWEFRWHKIFFPINQINIMRSIKKVQSITNATIHWQFVRWSYSREMPRLGGMRLLWHHSFHQSYL